jgi:hypothetical protein
MMSNCKKKTKKTNCFVFLSDFGWQLGGTFAIEVYKERLVKMHVEGALQHYYKSLFCEYPLQQASSWVLLMV